MMVLQSIDFCFIGNDRLLMVSDDLETIFNRGFVPETTIAGMLLVSISSEEHTVHHRYCARLTDANANPTNDVDLRP